jgi:hypothetical protein
VVLCIGKDVVDNGTNASGDKGEFAMVHGERRRPCRFGLSMPAKTNSSLPENLLQLPPVDMQLL